MAAASARSITVDRDLCMGSGMCVLYAPATFAHDDEAKAVVVDPAGDDAAAVDAAVEACPVRALRLAPDDRQTDDRRDR